MSFDSVSTDYLCQFNTPLLVLLIVIFLAILQNSLNTKGTSNINWDAIFYGIEGKIQYNVGLSPYTRFRSGGPAQVLYRPASVKELQSVLQKIPAQVSVTVLGLGSNVLIRDGGIKGVVIKLSHSNFCQFSADVSTSQAYAGAGIAQLKFAKACANQGISGLEFFCGIPGTVGGALKMNAGAHGKEVSNCLLSAQVIDRNGKIHNFSVDELKYTYRHCCGIPKDWIFLSGIFQGEPGIPSAINQKIEDMMTYRDNCQPVNERTAGCTFINPSGLTPAWKLINQAGLQGMKYRGNVQVSTKHANFLINSGNASSKEIEDFGNYIVQKVDEESGISLKWEVIRLGDF